jgi:hypothetical protein
MSRKALNRVERSVRALAPGPAPAPAADLDAGQLAREAAQAFADQLERYRRTRDTEAPLDPRERTPDFLRDLIRNQAPENVTFADIERLACIDPAAGAAKWEEVKAAAATDLTKGWRAARALELVGGNAWERACFLALRGRLHTTWPPRHDGEAVLLDQIAQYEILRQRWVAILSNLTGDPRTLLGLLAPDKKPTGERSTTARTAIEAARVIERLHGLIQGTVRTLLAMRRAPGAVVVRRVDQLNVAAGPQMNVNGTDNRTAQAAAPEQSHS